MGHKRSRNHYPRLSEAVLNLLALHSLRAIARKSATWRNGAAVSWVFDVHVDKPTIPFQRAVFSGRHNDTLEAWIKQVERYTTERVLFFQGMDWGQTEARVVTWLDESGELGHVDFKTLHGTYSSKSK